MICCEPLNLGLIHSRIRPRTGFKSCLGSFIVIINKASGFLLFLVWRFSKGIFRIIGSLGTVYRVLQVTFPLWTYDFPKYFTKASIVLGAMICSTELAENSSASLHYFFKLKKMPLVPYLNIGLKSNLSFHRKFDGSKIEIPTELWLGATLVNYISIPNMYGNSITGHCSKSHKSTVLRDS